MSQDKKKNRHNMHNNVYGILFMLLNACVIAALYTIMKAFTKSVDSSQAVFFYKFSLFLILLPWIFKKGVSSIYTKKLWLHGLRGLFSIAGSLCLMRALKHIDMMDATALGYMEQVILMVVGIVYFKEKLTRTKVLCMLFSLLGALIIVYPSILIFPSDSYIPLLFQEKDFKVNYYYLLVLASVAFWASNSVVIKFLGKSDGSRTQVFYVLLFSSIISYLAAFVHWYPVEVIGSFMLWVPYQVVPMSSIGLKMEHGIYIILLACCYFVHSIAFYKAIAYADISTVIPFDYSRLIFTGMLGALLLGEMPEAISYIGYSLILFAGVVMVRVEALERKRLKNKATVEAEFENV